MAFILVLIVSCIILLNRYYSQPAVLLVFNGHHDQEAENLLASIKKNARKLLPHIIVCASDDNSKAFATKHHLQFFEMSAITKTGAYLSHNFNIMTKRKFEAILHLLESHKNVLYVDTDVVLLTDPMKELNYKFDINIQNDQCAEPYDISYLCTGFMYINSNNKTISFFKQAINEIVKSDYKLCDQCVLNLLVNNNANISVNVLDVCKFPNGCRYFDNTDKNCSKKDALIVHNNYLVGVERKIKRFSDHGLIFYDTQ